MRSEGFFWNCCDIVEIWCLSFWTQRFSQTSEGEGRLLSYYKIIVVTKSELLVETMCSRSDREFGRAVSYKMFIDQGCPAWLGLGALCLHFTAHGPLPHLGDQLATRNLY
jgi:hypothetical protein